MNSYKTHQSNPYTQVIGCKTTERLAMLLQSYVFTTSEPFLVKSSSFDDRFSKSQVAMICSAVSMSMSMSGVTGR